MQFAAFAGQVAEIYPDALDTINFDAAMPDMAEAMGVSDQHIATAEQVAAKRQARQQQMAVQQAMQAADTAGKAYHAGKDAPEEDSPAKELIDAAKG